MGDLPAGVVDEDVQSSQGIVCGVRELLRAGSSATMAATAPTELRATLSPDLPGTARMVDAARLKARAAIALADCFAATTAAAHDLTLLTGDPELLELAVSSGRPPGIVKDRRPEHPRTTDGAARSDARVAKRSSERRRPGDESASPRELWALGLSQRKTAAVIRPAVIRR